MSRELPLAALGCSLDAAGAALQKERYETLVRWIRRVEREPLAVEAEFGPEVDEAVLLEAVEVERGCCPFFAIDWDRDEHRLRFAVSEPGHEAALDAVAATLASP